MAPRETSDEGVKKNRSGIESAAPHEKERDEKAYRDSPCLPFLLCHRSILRGIPAGPSRAREPAVTVNGGIFGASPAVPWRPEALAYPANHPPHIADSESLQPAGVRATFARKSSGAQFL